MAKRAWKLQGISEPPSPDREVLQVNSVQVDGCETFDGRDAVHFVGFSNAHLVISPDGDFPSADSALGSVPENLPEPSRSSRWKLGDD